MHGDEDDVLGDEGSGVVDVEGGAAGRVAAAVNPDEDGKGLNI